MKQIKVDIARLRDLAEKAEPGRNSSALLNDMFETAQNWADLGERLLANSPNTDFPGRVQQEIELVQSIRSYYGTSLQNNADFLQVIEIGERLIGIAQQRKMDSDGYLGSSRIIREKFSFLVHDFGFILETCQLSSAKYLANHLAIMLDLPSCDSSGCWLETLGNEPDHFQLETLLFQVGSIENLALPLGVMITTEAQVRAWFTKISAIIREFGHDLLANKPGAIERLVMADIERDQIIARECERIWRNEHPGEPLPTSETITSAT